MRKAKALSKGDKVAIVSLSGGMLGEEFCKHDIELGRRRLKEFGLEMMIMPNALKGISYLKEHPEARAADLKLAFSDKSIKAVICAIGGDDTYRLLPYLLEDSEFVDNVNSNPKIFTGFSDSTVNHLMFYKLGLTTYYGPNLINDLAELADDMLPYTKNAFNNYIEGNDVTTIHSSDLWYEERTDFSPNAIGTNRITHHENHGYELLQGNEIFSGALLGGCIDTMYDILAGNENGNSREICQKYHIFPEIDEWNEKILFIETSENCITPERLYEFLIMLKEKGIFDVITGVIIGKPQNEIYYEEYKEMYRKVLAEYPQISVVYNVNFGHAYPRMVLPYGLKIEVNMLKKEIRYLEKITE